MYVCMYVFMYVRNYARMHICMHVCKYFCYVDEDIQTMYTNVRITQIVFLNLAIP